MSPFSTLTTISKLTTVDELKRTFAPFYAI